MKLTRCHDTIFFKKIVSRDGQGLKNTISPSNNGHAYPTARQRSERY